LNYPERYVLRYVVASVHKDSRFPKGPWVCYFTRADGTRAKRSTAKHNRKEALVVCHAIQQAEDELASGDLSRDRLQEIFNETLKRLGEAPVKRISIGEWLTDWLDGKESLAANSKAAYEQVVREFLEYLGEGGVKRRLESITEQDIRGFVRKLRESGRSSATINKLVRKYLSGAFTKAQRLGYIRFNPIGATEPEKSDTARRDTFTPDQVVRLVNAAEGDWKGAILFAWTSGARLLDVANLRWTSLDLVHRIVTFRQRKTNREIIIGLHEDFEDWISQSPAADKGQEFVFRSLAGKPSNSSVGLSAQFDAIMKRAGVEGRLIREGNDGKGRTLRGLSFHSFRHSAASAIFNQAALKEIASRVTGHSGAVIDRYIHSDLSAIRAAVSLIPRLPK
jgi:integrase